MASTSLISMSMPLTHTKTSFMKPSLALRPSSKAISAQKQAAKFEVKASSLKEKAVTGLTAAVLTASMVIPDVAQAADGVPPSLKNFLLSISAGGVVVTAIIVAVIGVSNFDPVKRA